MTHIHKDIDFVVSVYITHNNKVLLIKHRELNCWLPVGGHIELNENPEEALLREVREECSLEIELMSSKPKLNLKDFKFLYAPAFIDIHKINDTHQHIGLEYFAKAKSNKIILNKVEHDDIRWFSKNELEEKKYNLKDNVIFYCKKALKLSTDD
jgi:8-oxo-dGTP pyrophosphatase MutT (NUDIX family)